VRPRASLAPTVTLLTTPDSPTVERSGTFTFSVNEESTTQVRIDGGEWQDAESPFTTPELEFGWHSFELRAVDDAENVSASAVFGWTIWEGRPTGPPPTAPTPVPHLALPLRLVGSSFAEVEQDTNEDIAVCVEAIVRTRPGDRDELPAFGVSDVAFGQVDAGGRPVDSELLVSQIEVWEPRVRALVSQEPDRFDKTIRRVRVGAVAEE